jgi:MoaA/NifB/PqqE/SkfB family radical SAM enzyme
MTDEELRAFARRNPDIVGALHGELAFAGPICAQIDLTNSCNSACIGCWARSPLLGPDVMPPEEQALYLPRERVLRLLDDLARSGTREIYLGGGGDPLCHPHLREVIARARELGMAVTLHTNFTAADESLVGFLLEAGLDYLTVSVWAADNETYLRTHPTRDPEVYPRLTETLRQVVARRPAGRPVIKLYHVICRENYDQLVPLFEQACALGVDGLEFAPIDSIPGRTESLLLDRAQLQRCIADCEALMARVRGREEQFPTLHGIERFLERIRSPRASEGVYDLPVADDPCYVGWLFIRVMADGKVTPCLKGDKHPVGNILEQSFYEIWNGPAERRFRRATRAPRKRGRFFRFIGKDPRTAVGCTRSCDDVSRNEGILARMSQLTDDDRRRLEELARSGELSPLRGEE